MVIQPLQDTCPILLTSCHLSEVPAAKVRVKNGQKEWTLHKYSHLSSPSVCLDRSVKFDLR